MTREPTPEAQAEAYRRSRRDDRLQYTYGMSADEYDEMYDTQNGVCALCGREQPVSKKTGALRPLAIDHDHRSGAVRGLLCDLCNVALGLLHDDPEWIEEFAQRAMRYLAGLPVLP